MASLYNSFHRERKQWKAQHGMRVTGKSVKLIQAILIKKGKKARKHNG